jgi:hypothetical protein
LLLLSSNVLSSVLSKKEAENVVALPSKNVKELKAIDTITESRNDGLPCSNVTESRDDGLPRPNSEAIENGNKQQTQQGVVTL